MIKRFKTLTIFSLIILICGTYFIKPTLVNGLVLDGIKPTFDIHSQAVYLVNIDSGELVYEQNKDKEIIPAALTSIMTAIIAIEEVMNIDKTIIIAPAYIYNEFSNISVAHADIKRGEEVTMEDLLYALILRSACEAANIIADHVGDGDIDDFVSMMNDKAKEIGAVNTKFTNPHGLYEKGQKTTAYDMYLITSYAMSLPKFEEIANATSYTMKKTNLHKEERVISHSNAMLSRYQGGSYFYEPVKGIKTGVTTESGRNLVTTASKNGYNYLLITLGAMDDGDKVNSYIDQKNLYEWAFNTFTYTVIINENETIGEVPVKMGSTQDYVTYKTSEQVTLLLPKDIEITSIERIYTLPESLNAPIKANEVIGVLEFKLSNQVIKKIPLITSKDIGRSEFLYGLSSLKKFVSNPLILILIIIWIAIIVLYIMCITATFRRRKKQKLRSRIYKNQDSFK